MYWYNQSWLRSIINLNIAMFKHPHPCPSLRSRVRSWRPSRLSGWLTQHHVSHVSPTLSLLRRLPVLKTICCRILVMDNTSRGPMNVYHGSLENPAMWLQYFEVQRCQRGFFHFLSIICKEERSIAWICITSNLAACKLSGPFCFPTWCGK